MPKESWFNRVRRGAGNDGVVINGLVHKCSPIRKGDTWAKGKCPKCNSPNGFIFRSHTDGKMYILFCQKCGKYSFRVKGDTPTKDTTGQCHAITTRGNRCSYKCVTHSNLCSIHESIRKEGRAVDVILYNDDGPYIKY
jgi:hypothetical protein